MLQLPIIKSAGFSSWNSNARSRVASKWAQSQDQRLDTLAGYLQQAGRFFGRDPNTWEQAGALRSCEREGL